MLLKREIGALWPVFLTRENQRQQQLRIRHQIRVMARKESVVEIEGRQLKLSNLDKMLYPEAGITKAQVIDYFVRIAPALLPHLDGRPLTMKRYPEGVKSGFFYEKNCPRHRPDWVQTARIWSGGNNRWMDYCMVQDLATLVWAANLADLELHVSLSLAKEIMQPTVIAFDLDPGAPANIVQCCQVGLWIKRIFDHFGLQSFAKTSGSKGLQIYVPLNTPVTYDLTKPFAKEIARLLEREHPDLVISEMKKSLRVNKIFVDWSQNDDHKTTICVYSLRAKERPTVSTPVTWDEVVHCLKKGDPNLLVFEATQVIERHQKLGDLFEPVLKLKQELPDIKRLPETAPLVHDEKRIASRAGHAATVTVSAKAASGQSRSMRRSPKKRSRSAANPKRAA